MVRYCDSGLRVTRGLNLKLRLIVKVMITERLGLFYITVNVRCKAVGLVVTVVNS